MSAEAFIGGVASLGLQAHSQYAADERADLSFQRQKELMALQNQYAVQNWERENNYNHPKEQMKRLKAAGLNPDLMYGSGAAGLQAGSISAPGAPASPMAPTMDFSQSVDTAVQAAVGIANAKKAKSETVAQNIENEYLEQRCRNDLAQQVETIGLTQDQRKELTARTDNIAKSTAALEVEMDATRKRLGYEELDRKIAAFDAITRARVAKNKIDDDTATRSARIFSLMARGRVDDANAYMLGLFKNPQKFKTFLTDWKDMLLELWNGVDGKDSEGHSGLNPINKNPKSPVAQAARSFFMAADDWISSWLGTEQPWK